MSKKDNLKLFGLGAFGVGLYLTVVPTLFNVVDNLGVDYRIKDGRIIKKLDGLFSYTEVTLHDNGGTEVERNFGIFGSSTFTDGDGDGFVEGIRERESFRSHRNDVYDWEKDGSKYKRKFDHANAVSKQQLKRFGVKR
ncbi:hypothetical protein CMI42_01100 [Candidatus Pacearchaeota archaeon]|nr:hypothetical protein [Candidatus Pacearchaeota archaeon]